MAKGDRRRSSQAAPPRPPVSAPRASKRSPSPRASSSRRWMLAGWGIGVLLLAAVAGVLFIANGPGSNDTAGAGAASAGTIVEGNGGHWTNITPDTLAAAMTHKDFTLLNVKTPYIGEIQGTDLYIPYDQVAARASELPADKTAKIVVYCRTGHESAIAAQTLLDLGYTNIENLDGGMTAWTASGRPLVQLGRS